MALRAWCREQEGQAVCSIPRLSSLGIELIKLRRFDSSVGRGDFKPRIGVGEVIRGMSFE